MSAISLHAKPSANFAHKLHFTEALLRQSADEFTPLTQASSLGAEDVVLTHLIAQLQIPASIFVLDTLMLHPETLALIPRIEARYGVKLDIYRPIPDAASTFLATHGERAMYQSVELRKSCCNLRKMEPLERALAGHQAWITGLRRGQSSARADVPDIDRSSARAKINPLADWTEGDVWHFISTHQVPYNPLHDEFFPSIGCAPCTRAVTLGEDPRSGRWWWENAASAAKECGLHVEKPATFESLSRIKITEIAA